MNKRIERPEVKLISKQWVRENCRNVTDRDLGLIKAVYQRRLVRRDQIEILYPEFPSTDFLNKRLTKLYKQHIIDRTYPPVGLGEGSSKQHICLDRAGAILLGIEKYNKPINPDKTLPLGWEHRIALNEYECIIRQTVKLLGAEIKLYQVEQPHAYLDTKLIPDINCLITCNGKGYLFFIEVDLGTEDIPYVKRKLDSYVDYYMSREWLKEPWARVFKIPTFPRVLFLTENKRTKRQNSLQEHTKDSGVNFLIDFHENFREILRGIVKGSH
jgi:hypothetical protein